MEINFDQIPSVTEIKHDISQKITVAEELQAARRLLSKRTIKCEPIKPVYKRPRIKPHKLAYKFFCICPRYRPQYCCKHVGNIIIDRDVLTKEEHICYLATPKPNFGGRRFMPRFFHRRVVVPDCTSRIEQLAQPDLKRVRETLEHYQHCLKKRQFRSLQKHLQPKPEVQYMNLNTALGYIEEERRLLRVQKRVESRRCKRIRKRIVIKQRRQIRKIICVLFEEMKDFLLNDQFLIDEKSTLCAVLLEQIREFTDKDFYTTSNLREYQQVLANNLTVWINKFISNLNIHVAPPQRRSERPEPETFLPVSDFIPASEPISEEEICPAEDTQFCEEFGEYDYTYPHDATEETLKNVN